MDISNYEVKKKDMLWWRPAGGIECFYEYGNSQKIVLVKLQE